MRCLQCQHQNEDSAKFCEECGARLAAACPQCGHQVSPTAKFCAECGATLSGKSKGKRQNPHPLIPDIQPLAERRQLTVMFCDLVGSTALSEQLDPEELREVVRAYQQTCAEAIRRYDGYIAQYLGDGVLVYFGYPLAHEDDAARAVRAGLEIIEALQSRARQQAGKASLPHGRDSDSHLQVRIGIHTGLVVVGEMGGGEKRENLALGETPNIAARVQGAAEPDTVMISAATYQLVHGLFECQDVGLQTLKGISTPLTLYRVVRGNETRSSFAATLGKGLTPLVGREEELGLLRRRWEQAKAGVGQVVLLSGEPGIGKSRLAETLKEQARQEGALTVELRCSPYHQNSAFYPIVEHLQQMLQFGRDESPQEKLRKLTVAVPPAAPLQDEVLPLLAALLSLPHPEGYPPLAFSPQKQKQKTHDALVAWLVKETEKTPVYCVWEDVHWADPSSVEVLTQLMAQVPTTRLLLLVTFRPEFIPLWGVRSYLSQLTISRLDRAAVETIVEQVTRGKSLPADLLQQIVRKTDGVPLFVEELTKSLIEAEADVGARRAVPLPLKIPATLQDALMARLDRLASVKEIAQLAAVLGREFFYELLQAVSPLDEEHLRQGLRRLVEAELMYQHGLPPQATYTFKHALIQDTAYQSLLKSRRQQLHQQIAQVLVERFPAMQETQPELLAHHYTEAGLIAQAIPYWQQAGKKAARRSAHAEAIAHLTKGLELIWTLPETPERAQQELSLHMTLGIPLAVTKGWAASEVRTLYNRTQVLCQQIGETPQLFPALCGLTGFYFIRAEHQEAHAHAQQLLRLAQSLQDSAFLLVAHTVLGFSLAQLGELTQARTHLEQVSAQYDFQQHHMLAALYTGQDLGVICRSHGALILGQLGYLDQAFQKSEEAIQLAQKLKHPFSEAAARVHSLAVHSLRWDARKIKEQVEAVIALSHEQGFPHWSAVGTIQHGYVLALEGRPKEGIIQIQQGLAAFHATGARRGTPEYLGCLAIAYATEKKIEESLRVVADALTIVSETKECFYEAELYRLKGELTLQSQVESHTSKVEEAEACFLKAIEVARKQQAKSLELRASMSLARLWQQQGKKAEARQMLAEIYNWFTEGFDTKDLQEAKVLLEELSR